MIDRLTGDLVKDLAWVVNWHSLDAATNRSDIDLARHLVAEILKLQAAEAGKDFQPAVDEATANPGRTVIVGEHGPELT